MLVFLPNIDWSTGWNQWKCWCFRQHWTLLRSILWPKFSQCLQCLGQCQCLAHWTLPRTIARPFSAIQHHLPVFPQCFVNLLLMLMHFFGFKIIQTPVMRISVDQWILVKRWRLRMFKAGLLPIVWPLNHSGAILSNPGWLNTCFQLLQHWSSK